MTNKRVSDVDIQKAVKQIFSSYDIDQNHYLQGKEIYQFLDKARHKQGTLLKCDIQEFMKFADKNRDRKISQKELFEAFRQICNT